VQASNQARPKGERPRSPTVLLDRDGVLNKNPGPGKYIRSWEEWEWLPGAKEALRLFHEAGYRMVIITNQSGIAQGLMTEDALADIHRNMKEAAKPVGGDKIAIYYCPHIQANGCECRKPKPGMLLQAQHDLGFDLESTFFIGDDERDRQAGEAAGCPSILVNDEVGLLEVTRQILSDAL
jgi:histidinol-phosphate phosphatase family protein